MVRYDPEQMYMLAKPIEDEYSELEEWLFLLLVNELLVGNYDTPEEWSLDKRKQAVTFDQKAQRIINATTQRVAKKLQTTMNAVEKETNKQVVDDVKNLKRVTDVPRTNEYKYTKSTKDVLDGYSRAQTINKVQSVVSELNGSMLNQLHETYIKQLDEIYKDLSTSHITVEKAVQKSMKPIAKDGIKAFTDSAGRKWQADVYMRTVMRNSIKMYHNDKRTNAFLEQGYTLVIVSEHAGSRPSHYHFQNKVYSLVEGSKYPHISETGIGDPAGLLGVNCRHFLMPYVEGMKIQEGRYTAEENEKMYEYLQQQRSYERAMREVKRQAELAKRTGEDELYRTYKRRSRELGSELNQMIEKANAEYDDFLRRQRDREKVF